MNGFKTICKRVWRWGGWLLRWACWNVLARGSLAGFRRASGCCAAGWVLAGGLGLQPAVGAETPSFDAEIEPILTKYCIGCHTEGESNGDLSLDDWDQLMAGGENGAVVKPGSADTSRLYNVLLRKIEPAMPPAGEPRPSDDDITLIRDWINGGAPGPASDMPADEPLRTPRLAPSDRPEPVTGLAFSPDGEWLIVGRFQAVELIRVADRTSVHMWQGLPGKVPVVGFSNDGRYVFAGTGIGGLRGETWIWEREGRGEVARLAGHRDMVYAAAMFDTRVATASYDRQIVLWNVDAADKPLWAVAEHNGPVYDLAFANNGQHLISGSDDATVKVWRAVDGTRLDTRGEPLAAQNAVAVRPGELTFVAGGEDNRIRVWDLISLDGPRINPLRIARYAHEAPITCLRFDETGELLVSVARDGIVKLWDTSHYQQVHAWPAQPRAVLAAAISRSAGHVVLGGGDGLLTWLALPRESDAGVAGKSAVESPVRRGEDAEQAPREYDEHEPNEEPRQALAVELPAEVRGVIVGGETVTGTDEDLVRFASDRGQAWVIEVHAARDKSPLDSHIEVLTAAGERIPRVLLQAVRDSYFTFRGKDSRQTNDFRLHNWEEMRLNQLLYCNGEVVKLYHYPRGPDSGFNVYPNFGERHGYFDTTPTTHALQEPCYIVEPLAPDASPVPNGLPVFPIYYENDDDAQRKAGRDSRLIFTAPTDGEYLVRIKDVRGHAGNDFAYRLTIRAPRPAFRARLIQGQNPAVGPGRGRKFGVEIDRRDGFVGPVRLEVTGVPPGLHVTTPLTIEAGHHRAWGTIWAPPDMSDAPVAGEQPMAIVASAEMGGRTVTQEPLDLGNLVWEPADRLRAELLADGHEVWGDQGWPVIEIVPGTTTTARVRIDRVGFAGRATFGSEDAAINAPHGVYVDNIGLNGVLIPEGQSERTIYLTAEPWVHPQVRPLFVESGQEGNPTSNPVWLRVLPADAD